MDVALFNWTNLYDKLAEIFVNRTRPIRVIERSEDAIERKAKVVFLSGTTMLSAIRASVATRGFVITMCLACVSSCHRNQPLATDNTATNILNKYNNKELTKAIEFKGSSDLEQQIPSDLRTTSTDELFNVVLQREKAIYGYDRRKDYWEIQHPSVQKNAESVAALVGPDRYQLAQPGCRIVGQILGQRNTLCSGEAYFDQITGPFCTGFVVGHDLIATAGHCIGEGWRATRIVFGFRRVKDSDGNVKTIAEVPLSEVFSPKEIVKREANGSGADYAVIRVDRDIKDHIPLELDDGIVQRDDGVYVLGYPSGLPLKLADGAAVRSISANGYFVSNLDTFGGNSGSPVFNAATHAVEGILVRGETDYQPLGTCRRAKVCPSTGCRGEDSTLISFVRAVVANVPSTPNESGLDRPGEKSLKNNLDQGGARSTNALDERRPILREFSSGIKQSGIGSQFSEEYSIASDPPPPGYKIAHFAYSLTGDRVCNSWSVCKASIVNDRVVMQFRLQGHNEWPLPRTSASEAHLLVTYAPR